MTDAHGLALLSQADLLLLLARSFDPPAVETIARFRAARAEFPLLDRRVGADGALRLSFERACRALDGTSESELSDEYHRLFDTLLACPINESGFVRRDKGAILGDVAGFYRAFGMDVSKDGHERADHLSCELEFVAVLLVMLANARAEGRAEAAEITEKALSAFALDHLSEWLPGFSAQLQRATRLPFYRHLAELLHETWRLVCKENRVPAAPGGTPLEPERDEGTPYECGLGPCRPI